MTDQRELQPILYAEPGSSWWPVLWGPAFAAVFAGVEATTGPVHTVGWLLVALGLAVISVVWVAARRRLCSVRLTPTALYQGREELAVARIVEVSDAGVQMGARVLGGGLTVPKKFEGVPLRLDDDSTVLAWAKDGEALHAELRKLVEA
ncbi:MAG: hypothetical protein ACRDRN_18940 [Sciscionella sp.]